MSDYLSVIIAHGITGLVILLILLFEKKGQYRRVTGWARKLFYFMAVLNLGLAGYYYYLEYLTWA